MKDYIVSKPICVIDGQGGGMGAALVKALKQVYGESLV